MKGNIMDFEIHFDIENDRESDLIEHLNKANILYRIADNKVDIEHANADQIKGLLLFLED